MIRVSKRLIEEANRRDKSTNEFLSLLEKQVGLVEDLTVKELKELINVLRTKRQILFEVQQLGKVDVESFGELL